MSAYEIETLRRVFDNENGGCVTIGPDRYGLGCIEIWTEEGKSEECFGKVRLVLPKAMAAKVAEALRLCAEEAP